MEKRILAYTTAAFVLMALVVVSIAIAENYSPETIAEDAEIIEETPSVCPMGGNCNKENCPGTCQGGCGVKTCGCR